RLGDELFTVAARDFNRADGFAVHLDGVGDRLPGVAPVGELELGVGFAVGIEGVAKPVVGGAVGAAEVVAFPGMTVGEVVLNFGLLFAGHDEVESAGFERELSRFAGLQVGHDLVVVGGGGDAPIHHVAGVVHAEERFEGECIEIVGTNESGGGEV